MADTKGPEIDLDPVITDNFGDAFGDVLETVVDPEDDPMEILTRVVADGLDANNIEVSPENVEKVMMFVGEPKPGTPEGDLEDEVDQAIEALMAMGKIKPEGLMDMFLKGIASELGPPLIRFGGS